MNLAGRITKRRRNRSTFRRRQRTRAARAAEQSARRASPVHRSSSGTNGETHMTSPLSETASGVVAQPLAKAGQVLLSLIVYFLILAALCTLPHISQAASPAEMSKVLRKCQPKRAVVKIDYKPLKLGLPRVMPVGDIKLAFTVSREGKAVDIRTVWSRSDWLSWDTAAMAVLSGAKFDAPMEPCRQEMRFKFKLGK
jgi:hypothetical protein